MSGRYNFSKTERHKTTKLRGTTNSKEGKYKTKHTKCIIVKHLRKKGQWENLKCRQKVTLYSKGNLSGNGISLLKCLKQLPT